MNPTFEWQDRKDERYLLLHFARHFSAESARDAIRTISPMIMKTEGKITMVWECSDMAGFDQAAREAWQIFVKDIKSKIERIHLVSNKLLIRSGAVVVGIFAGIKINTWAKIDEIP